MSVTSLYMVSATRIPIPDTGKEFHMFVDEDGDGFPDDDAGAVLEADTDYILAVALKADSGYKLTGLNKDTVTLSDGTKAIVTFLEGDELMGVYLKLPRLTASTPGETPGTPGETPGTPDTTPGTPGDTPLSPETNPVSVSKISISGISKKLAAGKKVQLTATITPENATNQILTWKSNNTKYATVSNTGKVSLKKAGAGKTVTITATATDGSGKKAAVKIKIK